MRWSHLDKETVRVLSPLEKDILMVLWKKQQARAREVYQMLKITRELALSSVAVLLDRLYQRKIVDRKVEIAQGGPRYIYSPKQNKNEFETAVVENTVNKLIAAFGKNAIAYFHERFGKE